MVGGGHVFHKRMGNLLCFFFNLVQGVLCSRDGNLDSTCRYPTLMGWILPGPIKNRVGYGFKKKNPKRVRVRFEFYQKTRNPTRLRPGYIIYKITKLPSYIYIYIVKTLNSPFRSSFQPLTPLISSALSVTASHLSAISHARPQVVCIA